MWLLVVMMFSVIPNKYATQGSIQVRTNSQEECVQLRKQFTDQLSTDQIRVSASCTFVGIR